MLHQHQIPSLRMLRQQMPSLLQMPSLQQYQHQQMPSLRMLSLHLPLYLHQHLPLYLQLLQRLNQVEREELRGLL
jgi:hypothetical protein